jgi:hypothetical protein
MFDEMIETWEKHIRELEKEAFFLKFKLKFNNLINILDNYEKDFLFGSNFANIY